MEPLKTDPEAFLGLVVSSNKAANIAGGVMDDRLVRRDRASAILGEAAYGVQRETWRSAKWTTSFQESAGCVRGTIK
ncbi:MAG: hypothetical protein ACK5ZD_03165 [Hyphomonadaceae bacterium]